MLKLSGRVPEKFFLGWPACLCPQITDVLEVSTPAVQGGVTVVAERHQVPEFVRPAEAGLEDVVRSPVKGAEPPRAVLAALPCEPAQLAPHSGGLLAL